MALSGTQFTRLGAYGGSRARRPAFIAKEEDVTEIIPIDDDADVAVTVRLDRDGATIRPPRWTQLTATNSLANAALEGPDRVDLDVYEAHSGRIGRGTEIGSLIRTYGYSNRAADAAAIRAYFIEFESLPITTTDRLRDTASGTDKDGAHVRVPDLELHTAADSLRNVELDLGSGSDRDALYGFFHQERTLNVGGHVRSHLGQFGRAGDAFAVSYFEFDFDAVGPELMRDLEF